MAEPPREPHVRAASFGRQEHAGDEITGERLMSGQGRKRATASANARWTAAPIVKTGRSSKPGSTSQPRLNQSNCPLDGVIYAEITRIEQIRVVCTAHWCVGAAGVSFVAGEDLGKDRRIVAIIIFKLAAACPHFGAGRDIELRIR